MTKIGTANLPLARTQYARMANDQLNREFPERPYRGKAGRRAHIKWRRFEKQIDAIAAQS